MARRFIYGDGYGDIANRELATDAARDARYFQSLASNRANRGQDLQEQQAGVGNDLAWQQLLASVAQNMFQNRNAMGDDEFRRQQAANNLTLSNADLGLRTKAEEANENYRRGMLDLNKRQLDLQSGPDAVGEPDYVEALDLVNKGYFDRTQPDLPALYPGMNPTRLARLGTLIGSRRTTMAEGDTSAENQAKLLNDQLLNLRRSNLVSKLGTDASTAQQGMNLPRWMGGGGTEGTLRDESAQNQLKVNAGQMDDQLAPLPATDQNFQKFLQTLTKNPKLAASLSFDENTQQVLPVRRAMPTMPTIPASNTSAPLPAPPPAQRQPNTIYMTPKGPLRWSGTGWSQP